MKPPKISVCIPVHNAELWLAESIQSIIDQTFDKNFEIVIVDDASNDSTKEIIRHFIDSSFHNVSSKEHKIDISCHYLEKNMGIAYCRNKAVKESSGEIIVVQDADDISHKERLEKTWAYFKRHDNVDLIYGSCQYIDPLSKPFNLVQAEEFDFEKLKSHNYIQHPTVAYRKKAFLEVGGYRKECKVVDDWFLYYDFHKKGKKIGKLDDVLSFYRVLPDSVSRSPEKEKMVQEMKQKFMEESGAICTNGKS